MLGQEKHSFILPGFFIVVRNYGLILETGVKSLSKTYIDYANSSFSKEQPFGKLNVRITLK